MTANIMTGKNEQDAQRKTVKRTYKDGIFRKLFQDKKLLLELYNALSGSNYPAGTPIEIVTLDNVIFGDLKNDLAFIIDNKLIILIEHQSIISPNLPLRMFCYLAKEYEKFLYSNAIYSKRLVQIPTPELYVFYNGIEEQPLEQELKLSDAFFVECDKINLEAVVKVINVNYEKGAEILKRCQTLNEYSRLIQMTRVLIEETGDKRTAIEKSIQRCMKEGVLVDFLKGNGGDVVSFLYDALTREECEAIREEDGYYRGLDEGKREGQMEGRLEAQREIAKNFKVSGIPIDVIAANTGLSEEEIESL